MTIRHRIVITCAEEVSTQTLANLERALAELEIETTSADINDDAFEPGLVPLYIADASTQGMAAPDHPRAIRILITDGSEPAPKHWLPLRAEEIGVPSKSWLAVLRDIGQAIERPGLPDYASAAGDHDKLSEWAQRFPHDALAMPVRASQSPEHLRAELEAAIRRAREAEQTALERDTARKRAEHDAQLARKKAVAGQNALDQLSLQNEALKLHLEESLWAPARLNGDRRQLVEAARQAVWRARAAAAAADRAEEAGVDHRVWPEQDARYVGHTVDRRPHGVGVMRFGEEQNAPLYRGEFQSGLRHGYGIGVDATGRVWSGDWKHDEPSGFGALELPDGSRLEGRVAPKTENEPAYRNLHVWSPTEPAASERPVYSETRLAIEAPTGETSRAN